MSPTTEPTWNLAATGKISGASNCTAALTTCRSWQGQMHFSKGIANQPRLLQIITHCLWACPCAFRKVHISSYFCASAHVFKVEPKWCPGPRSRSINGTPSSTHPKRNERLLLGCGPPGGTPLFGASVLNMASGFSTFQPYPSKSSSDTIRCADRKSRKTSHEQDNPYGTELWHKKEQFLSDCLAFLLHALLANRLPPQKHSWMLEWSAVRNRSALFGGSATHFNRSESLKYSSVLQWMSIKSKAVHWAKE